MISKYLVSTLVTATVLAGFAVPAQAEPLDPPTQSAPAISEQPAVDSASTDGPSVPATATPKPAPATPSAVPTAQPSRSASVSVLPSENDSPTVEVETEAPAPKLKTNKVSGNLSGTTLKIPKNEWREVKGKITQNAWGNARIFRIEIYSSSTKKWSTYKRGETDPQGGWKEYIEKTSAASQLMRLVVEADDTYEKYTGPKTTIQRGKTTIKISVGANAPTIHSVPWEQQRFRFSTNDSSTALPFQLQKKSGKKWVRVSGLTSKKGMADYSFKLPLGNKSSRDGTVAYRVAMTGNSGYEAVGSATRNVRWENPNRYTGMAKKAYDYAKGYCPAVLVRLDGNLAKSGRWGEYIIGSNPATMKVYSRTPDQHLRTVALHECAHNLQEKSAAKAGKGGWASYQAKANQLFGTQGSDGIELAAECMAYNMGPKSYWAYGANSSLCSRSAVKSFAVASIKGQRVS